MFHDLLQVRRVVMSVRNVGRGACRNMTLAVSHPEVAVASCVVVPAAQQQQHQHYSQPQHSQFMGHSNSGKPVGLGSGSQAITLDRSADTALQECRPEVLQPVPLPGSLQGSGVTAWRPLSPDTQLQPGDVQHWELWLHPRGAGALTVQLAWYCEPCKV